MKRIFLFFLLIPLLFAGKASAQPCDCKWPVDVIILHTGDPRGSAESMSGLASLADSLKKSCHHLFVVSGILPDASGSASPVPYAVLKAGKGNRIALLGAVRLRKNGMPDGPQEKIKTVDPGASPGTPGSIEKLLKRKVLLAVTRERLDNDRRLSGMMSRFDLVIGDHPAGSEAPPRIGKTFLRLDRGKIIFIKEETI